MSLSEMYWQQIFSIIQISFHAFICILLFHLYLRFKIDKIVSLVLTVIIGFNPSLIFYSTYILADHFLAVLTTLSWIFTIRFSNNFYKRKNFVDPILIGRDTRETGVIINKILSLLYKIFIIFNL